MIEKGSKSFYIVKPGATLNHYRLHLQGHHACVLFVCLAADFKYQKLCEGKNDEKEKGEVKRFTQGLDNFV